MVYLVLKPTPVWHQMTLEELLYQDFKAQPSIPRDMTATRTYELSHISDKFLEFLNTPRLIEKLQEFANRHAELYDVDRETLFSTFYREKSKRGMGGMISAVFASEPRYIPGDSKEFSRTIADGVRELMREHETSDDSALREKVFGKIAEKLNESGFHLTVEALNEMFGENFRRIDAPKTQLKCALYDLKAILEDDFRALYHTSAFAYIHGRSVQDVAKRHQANESWWFGHYDLHNFFGSTTLNFVTAQFMQIFPFCEVMKWADGFGAVRKALDLAFLNGVLPQGTPISPLITNVMMIPIDFRLSRALRDFEGQRFVYTRYADDFVISSRTGFDKDKVGRLIDSVLDEFLAPFRLNTSKTKYISKNFSNWVLGVMLNKDNNITVGRERKEKFRAALHNYIMDKRRGIMPDRGELMALHGNYSWYSSVEPDNINGIIRHMNEKYGVDVIAMIRSDLAA